MANTRKKASKHQDDKRRVAAMLLLSLDGLDCLYVLNEKFESLVVHYYLCIDSDDYEGANSAFEDLVHYISHPNSND